LSEIKYYKSNWKIILNSLIQKKKKKKKKKIKKKKKKKKKKKINLFKIRNLKKSYLIVKW